MLGTLILDNWKPLLLATLVALSALFFKLWQDTRAEYIAYGAGVEALGRQVLAEKERTERERKDKLEAIKNEYESKLPEVRANAVAAYRAAHRLPERAAGGGAVSAAASGEPRDDDAVEEPLPAPAACDDAELISEAARDALIIEQWRAYCIRNECPVE